MSKYGAGVGHHKIFSKNAKNRVTSVKIGQASAARRKHEARFSCAIEGCNSNFTRRHNLNSGYSVELPNYNALKSVVYDLDHLKAHCGITDMICHLCGKAFTTSSVLRRHLSACRRLK